MDDNGFLTDLCNSGVVPQTVERGEGGIYKQRGNFVPKEKSVDRFLSKAENLIVLLAQTGDNEEETIHGKDFSPHKEKIPNGFLSESENSEVVCRNADEVSITDQRDFSARKMGNSEFSSLSNNQTNIFTPKQKDANGIALGSEGSMGLAQTISDEGVSNQRDSLFHHNRGSSDYANLDMNPHKETLIVYDDVVHEDASNERTSEPSCPPPKSSSEGRFSGSS
jgi:hypothetical protein